jgi:peptide/nickel transport system permease protein
MSSFLIRRFLQSILLMVVLSFVTFTLMGWMPGDPLDVACSANPHCTPENVQQMKAQMGLDKPITHRYALWAVSAIQGDFGYSRTYRLPVGEILWPRFGNTLILGLMAFVLSLVVAIPLGMIASLKPRSWADSAISFFSFMGISAPSFWIGLMLILIFSVNLGVLPAGGISTIGASSQGFFAMLADRLQHLILPILTLSLLTIAGWLRYVRSSMIEVLRMDFVRTAKAKGLQAKKVYFWHAGRNALIPVVTVIGLSLPGILSGAVITESVFAYPGMGKLLYDSILNNDFNVAMSCFLISCIAVLLSSLIVDILYAVLDPRIRLS